MNLRIRMPSAVLMMAVAAHIAGAAKSDWTGAPLERDPKEGVRPCDWLELHAAPGPKSLRIAYRCVDPIDFSLGAAYCVYLDTDGHRKTGYRGSEDTFPIGADYLLQGATLYRYSGDGIGWSWTIVGEAPAEIAGDWAEFTLSERLLPLPDDVIFVFLLGDNTAEGVGGDRIDEMPNGALRKGGGGKSIRIKMR